MEFFHNIVSLINKSELKGAQKILLVIGLSVYYRKFSSVLSPKIFMSNFMNTLFGECGISLALHKQKTQVIQQIALIKDKVQEFGKNESFPKNPNFQLSPCISIHCSHNKFLFSQNKMGNADKQWQHPWECSSTYTIRRYWFWEPDPWSI